MNQTRGNVQNMSKLNQNIKPEYCGNLRAFRLRFQTV